MYDKDKFEGKNYFKYLIPDYPNYNCKFNCFLQNNNPN